MKEPGNPADPARGADHCAGRTAAREPDHHSGGQPRGRARKSPELGRTHSVGEARGSAAPGFKVRENHRKTSGGVRGRGVRGRGLHGGHWQ